MAIQLQKQLVVTSMAIMLAACGGGSGGSDTGNGNNTGGNNGGTPSALMTIQHEQVNKGAILSWEPVAGATSYTVYFDREAINPSSPAAGTESQTCASSPCYVDGMGNGVYNIVVTATGANARSNNVAIINGALNDTGADKCGNITSNDIDCSADGDSVPGGLNPAGQDASLGRDANNSLIKAGAGNGGFDFTKLDASGNALADSATEWSCIRDNVTGLIWENKISDGNAVDQTFNALADARHGQRLYNGSASNDPDLNDNTYSTDTRFSGSVSNLIATANADSLCGFTDWRLPTVNELLGIVDFSKSRSTSELTINLDTDYFQNNGFLQTGFFPSTFFSSIYLTSTRNPNNKITFVNLINGDVLFAQEPDYRHLTHMGGDGAGCVRASTVQPNCSLDGAFARLVRGN